MAGTGLLRPILQQALRVSLKQTWQKGILYMPAVSAKYVSIRNMSDGPRKMEIKPSRFEWESFKDDLNYYLWLGLLPMGLLIFYVNMFVGQAELKDIPEGYEPEHWEYHKGPIQRWLVKNVYNNPEDEYEKILQCVHEEYEQIKMRKLEHQVRSLMNERRDYKGWYYVPVEKEGIDAAIDVTKQYHRVIGAKTID